MAGARLAIRSAWAPTGEASEGPDPPCPGLQGATRMPEGLRRGSAHRASQAPSALTLPPILLGAWEPGPRSPGFESLRLSLLCNLGSDRPLPRGLDFFTCNMGFMQLLALGTAVRS